MGKNIKAVTKCCPFCELQVAVACKACPGCQHSFVNAKKLSLAQSAIDDGPTGFGFRRRTERVKREKPNYYDASEFEKKTKKKRNSRLKLNTSEPERIQVQWRLPPPMSLAKKKMERSSPETTREGGGSNTETLKKKCKKKPGKSIKENDDEDPFLNLSKEKLVQLSIVLAEINRKIFSTGWRA